jgi:sec-independent protein translocase protein TatC
VSEKEEKLIGDSDSGEVEMTFLEHLEDLRWRIFYSLIGIFVGFVAAWIFKDFLVNIILLKPAEDAGITLQNLRPFGQLFLFLQVALIVGFIISIPNVFYQLWKFISPALKSNERKYITSIVVFSSICFAVGVVFAYFVMLPITLKVAVQFGTERIENNFSIDYYFSIIISLMLAAGIVFELPMLSFFLSKIGIVTPEFMRKWRRHSIVGILIIAAILTPGADPVAQLLLAVPLVFLYEISIFVSKFSQKKLDK